MNEVYLSIGTNMGNRLHNLQQAVKLLVENPATQVQSVSSIYETTAVGFTDQADFLNIAVRVSTTLNAFEMLDVCQNIENELGRVRDFRWGPRIIDLDILLYNHENIEAENLIIPHERMFERAFVLIPLVDIAPYPSENPQLLRAHKERDNMDSEKEGVVQWKAVGGVEEFVRLES